MGKNYLVVLSDLIWLVKGVHILQITGSFSSECRFIVCADSIFTSYFSSLCFILLHNRESNSFQGKGTGQAQTIFIRGFDTSVGEDEVN